MKKTTWIILILTLLLSVSCDSIKNAVNTASNNDQTKAKYKYVTHPNNVKNAKSDAHTADETAIICSLFGEDLYYVGEKGPFDAQFFGGTLLQIIDKNPAEKQKIYVNIGHDIGIGEVARMIDVIRLNDIDKLGLIVSAEASTVKAIPPFHILNVKIMPELKIDDTDDLWLQMTLLNLSKDGKIHFAKFEKNSGFKNDKTEIKTEEVEAKVKELLKEREDKKFYLKGTSEVDKRIYIRATRSNNYGEALKLIDAATGAGAEVYFMIDDLSN